jgi:hypothetical protein
MEMKKPLGRAVTVAENNNAEIALCNWGCGDGTNMGSFMIKVSTTGSASKDRR